MPACRHRPSRVSARGRTAVTEGVFHVKQFSARPARWPTPPRRLPLPAPYERPSSRHLLLPRVHEVRLHRTVLFAACRVCAPSRTYRVGLLLRGSTGEWASTNSRGVARQKSQRAAGSVTSGAGGCDFKLRGQQRTMRQLRAGLTWRTATNRQRRRAVLGLTPGPGRCVVPKLSSSVGPRHAPSIADTAVSRWVDRSLGSERAVHTRG